MKTCKICGFNCECKSFIPKEAQEAPENSISKEHQAKQILISRHIKEFDGLMSSENAGCGKEYIKDGEKYVCGSYFDKLLCSDCKNAGEKFQ